MTVAKRRTAAVVILILGILFCPGVASMAQAQTPNCGPTGTDATCTITGAVTLTKATQTAASQGILSAFDQWNFTIHVNGKVGGLGVSIKEYSPGAAEYCWVQGNQHSIPPGTMYMHADNIPAATRDACSTTSNKFPDPDAQLYVYANIQTGDSKASVVIDVTYPNPNHVPLVRLADPSMRGEIAASFAPLWGGLAVASEKTPLTEGAIC